MRKTEFTIKMLKVRAKMSFMSFIKKIPVQELLFMTILNTYER